jgi:hypothetical protein
MASLAEIRAKLAAQENNGNNNSSRQSGDNSIYAHWNIQEGENARIRFLPDADPNNTFFWVERAMIRLPFAGIKGDPSSKPVTVQVPCMEMYGKEVPCPILAEVRTWFKDPSLEDMGRKYWKKRSYLFQGFVRENPISDDTTPENPIRRFIISPQIFNLVKSALMDPELENLPTDYDAGLDFIVTKTSKGGYADYSTSKWARKETSLTADEASAVDSFGLYNLTDFLPKKPGEVELNVIKEMFEASVNGEEYDPERWAGYYKPPGLQYDGPTQKAAPAPVAEAAPAPSPKAEPVKESAPWEDQDETAASAPVEAPAESGGNKKAEDILAMIRSRQS